MASLDKSVYDGCIYSAQNSWWSWRK